MRPVPAPAPIWAHSAFATTPAAAWPFYCEENALRAALAWAHAHPDGPEPALVFIFNRAGAVRFDAQRAAPPGAPLLWDYHVVLLADGHIHDPDCRAGARLPAPTWLAASFPGFWASAEAPHPADEALPPELAPTFRVVGLSAARAHFSSDRRHMRSESGIWHQPPPPWPAPSPAADGAPHTLPRFLDPDDPLAEAPVDLPTFKQSVRPTFDPTAAGR